MGLLASLTTVGSLRWKIKSRHLSSKMSNSDKSWISIFCSSSQVAPGRRVPLVMKTSPKKMCYHDCCAEAGTNPSPEAQGIPYPPFSETCKGQKGGPLEGNFFHAFGSLTFAVERKKGPCIALPSKTMDFSYQSAYIPLSARTAAAACARAASAL